MSIEQNKLIARRHFEEVWNNGDMAAADQIYAPNYFHHPSNAADITPKSRDEFKQAVAQMRASYEGYRFTIEDIFAEGDKVAIRWIAGQPGQQPLLSGIDIQRIVDGRIVEDWNAVNDLSPRS